MRPHPLPSEPTEGEIQHAAYFLWEQEGRPRGRDLELWMAAKARLQHTVHRARELHRRSENVPRADGAQAAPPGKS